MAMKKNQKEAQLFSDGEGWHSSKKLYGLIYRYLSITKESHEKGMRAFHKLIEDMKSEYWEDEERITNAEENLLKRAIGGDLKSIQFLVRRDPNVIYLPFVQEKMMDILLQYKWDRPSGDMKIDIREVIWPGFLPERPGGKLHFNEYYLNCLKEWYMRSGATKARACRIIADEHKISFDRLYRRLGHAGKRGRPKKDKNRN
jgi:hypothetical protein